MGSAAADELIGRASQLRTDQIVGLATTTRRTIGRGVRGYLGLRSPALTTASLAAEAALKQVDLEDEMRTKVTALNEAVLSASMAAAEGRGRDTTGVREAWQRFQHAVDSEGRQERQRAFRSAKKAFRRGLGLQLAAQVADGRRRRRLGAARPSDVGRGDHGRPVHSCGPRNPDAAVDVGLFAPYLTAQRATRRTVPDRLRWTLHHIGSSGPAG